MKPIQLLLLATIVFSFTISCSNQSDKAQGASNQTNIANDTSKAPATKIAQKITPCLWVEKDAKAVADYYLSIFKDGKLKDYRQFKNMPKQEGLNDPGYFETAVLELQGMEFSILAAGPLFKFNEAISLVINCKDQTEVDYYWDALTKNGGEEGPCGWCKDKYGLSWQVVPVEYFELIHSTDSTVRNKAMINTFKQKKIILSELK
jgi:predicted 3-demethylubiquinone-9 3-methyltransferase (glyoxalase superfamily)